jgi:hypothetical protein
MRSASKDLDSRAGAEVGSNDRYSQGIDRRPVSEAAELEHELVIHYLFASFSPATDLDGRGNVEGHGLAARQSFEGRPRGAAGASRGRLMK